MSDSDSSLDFESADEGALNNDDDIGLSDLDLSDDEDVKTKQNISESNKQSEQFKTSVEQNIQANDASSSSEIKRTDPIEQLVQTSVKTEESSESPLEINHLEIKSKRIEKEHSQKVENMEVNAKKLEISRSNETHVNPVESKRETEEIKSIEKSAKIEIEKPKKVESSGWDDGNWDDLDDDNENESSEAQIVPSSIKKEERNISSETKTSKDIQSTPERSHFPTRSESSLVTNNQNQIESGNASSWGWSKLGSNFLSSALTITAQIGGSINTVLESVEATIGAPDPAELAAKIAKSNTVELESQPEPLNEQASKFENDWSNDSQEWFTLPPFNKLASTGLDVLESVGKKTFNALHEKDPNLKQTRELLKKVPVSIASMNQKPNLSQLLREAQSEQSKRQEESTLSSSSSFAPSVNTKVSNKSKTTEKATFSQFFEEFKGVVHLEGLEMLSRQSSVRFEMFSINKSKLNSKDVKENLSLLREFFDANNFSDEESANDSELDQKCHEDFALLVNKKTNHFDVEHAEFMLNDYSRHSRVKLTNLDKVLGAYRTTVLGINDVQSIGGLFDHSIKCFALITANIIEFYHKTAQFYLMDQESHAKSANKYEDLMQNAQTLYMLTRLFVRCVSVLVEDISKKCKEFPKEKHTNQVVTDIFLEASNCTTYVCDAFLLFLPIFNSRFAEEF